MPTRSRPDAPLLTLRELNRALLARQMLLAREKRTVVDAIARLGALQAQWPRAPYTGLWTRLERFAREDLERELRARRVVKATLMRGTLHLATARDYPFYTVAASEARRQLWHSTQRQLVAFYERQLPAVRRFAREGRAPIPEPEKLHRALLRYATAPRSREELIAFIERESKIPHELATHLVWGFVAAHGMLVHAPESGLYDADRAGGVVAATAALRGMTVPAFDDAVLHTVTRHLAAFGPATIDDVSSWTSIRAQPIREAITRLGAKITRYVDERGRTLYDLARSPRPSAETPAAPRFLPKWDSTLLAYTPPERVRILPEEYRPAVIAKNGDVAQTILIDGFVAGTWATVRRTRDTVVAITPFRRLGRAEKTALVAEGTRLARFVAPDAKSVGAKVG